MRAIVTPGEVILRATETSVHDITDALEKMVLAIRDFEDPVELKKYRALFKKNVPFNLRGYLSAYMIKTLVSYGTLFPKGSHADLNSKSKRPTTKQQIATDSGLQLLFVSVGRNQRIRPADLLNLITSTVQVDRSNFGKIKILDNYSFIEVPDTVASEAIASLSGRKFRGRRITVDFARTKN